MSIFRYPWVGYDYNSQKTKILFVGESHYSDPKNPNAYDIEKENSNYTNQCIREYCDWKWGNRTWGNLVSQFIDVFGTGKYARSNFFVSNAVWQRKLDV